MATQKLGQEFGLFQSTVWRLLRRAAVHKVKPTWKPGLSNVIKVNRLAFALKHKD